MLHIFLLSLAVGVAGEGFMYMHPVNPRFHPQDMYPIKKDGGALDKVRDLPQSGVVYLHRIKPITEEFKQKVHGEETFLPKQSLPVPLPISGSVMKEEDDYSNYEDEVPSTTIKPVVEEDHLSEDDEKTLDELLQQLTDEERVDTISDNSASVLAQKLVEPSYVKGHTPEVVYPKPRLVTLHGTSGTAAVNKRMSTARSVRLPKQYGSTAKIGSKADFDPWERQGQKA